MSSALSFDHLQSFTRGNSSHLDSFITKESTHSDQYYQL